MVFSFALEKATMLFNWLGFMTDFIGIFAVVSWVFVTDPLVCVCVCMCSMRGMCEQVAVCNLCLSVF